MQDGCGTRNDDKLPVGQPRPLDLNLLPVFEAILRHRSVTRAAEELGLSQGAISHALGRLRSHFGDPLFVKVRNAMAPTAKSLDIAENVSRIVALAQETAKNQVLFDPAHAARAVTICVNDFGEIDLLPRIYSRMRTSAPHCTLRTVAADGAALIDFIENGRADLVICGSLNVAGEIMRQRLFVHPFCLIVSRDSPLEGPVTEAQFLAMEHVVFVPRKSLQPNLYNDWQTLAQKRRVRIQTAHHVAVPLVIGRDPTLAAVVPRTLAQLSTALGVTKVVPTTFSLPVSHIYQYWHRRFDNDPYNIWLRGLVRQTFSDHENGDEDGAGVINTVHDEDAPCPVATSQETL